MGSDDYGSSHTPSSPRRRGSRVFRGEMNDSLKRLGAAKFQEFSLPSVTLVKDGLSYFETDMVFLGVLKQGNVTAYDREKQPNIIA